MIRRPPRSTQSRSSAASDVYKRQKGHRLASGRTRKEIRPLPGSDVHDGGYNGVTRRGDGEELGPLFRRAAQRNRTPATFGVPAHRNVIFEKTCLAIDLE